MTADTRKTFYHLFPDWLAGAFCLAIPALCNSYPLVTSDSGAYILNGYTLQLPLDRPIAYSIFVRISSMGATLWGVVALQAMILSLLMLVITRHLLKRAYSRGVFAAVMLLTGVATSAGWFAGQVMPDIFTGILLLACCVLNVVPVSRPGRWSLYALMLVCMLMHNSNLLIALLMGVLLLIYCLCRKNHMLRRTSVALLATSALGWVSLSSMNAIAGRGFRPSAASHVFLMCRMVENGMMDNFLSDYCPTDSNQYKLCAYRGRLPLRQWDFMWNEHSPLYATGGWEANEEEYSRIIRKTLTTPKYLALHTIKAVQGTLRQLPLIYVGDGLFSYDQTSSPDYAIATHITNEIKEFHAAAQQGNALHFDLWNGLIMLFTLLVCVTALLLSRSAATAGIHTNMKQIFLLSLLFIIINAAVTATLATVIGRYEARVFWVLPFLSILYIVRSLHRNDEEPAAV